MTTEFVLRLDKKRTARLTEVARERRKSRGALVRQAIDNLLAEPRSQSNSTRKTENGKSPVKTKGVGWAEHFEWLRKHGRRIDSKIVDEVLAASRNRAL